MKSAIVPFEDLSRAILLERKLMSLTYVETSNDSFEVLTP